MHPGIPALIALALSGLLLSYRYLNYRFRKIRRRRLEVMRHKYKKALNGNDPDAARTLGIEYYTAVCGGKITDVDRKRVEYAVSLMTNTKA